MKCPTNCNNFTRSMLDQKKSLQQNQSFYLRIPKSRERFVDVGSFLQAITFCTWCSLPESKKTHIQLRSSSKTLTDLCCNNRNIVERRNYINEHFLRTTHPTEDWRIQTRKKLKRKTTCNRCKQSKEDPVLSKSKLAREQHQEQKTMTFLIPQDPPSLTDHSEHL